MGERQTCVEKIERVVEIVVVGQLCVSTEHDERVANQQASVAYTRSRTIARGGNGVTCHAAIAHFGQPQVALDCRTAHESSHEVDGAIF